MSDRCIQIGGSLVRVTDKFDSTPGSDDMRAMEELLASINSPEAWAKSSERLGKLDCKNRRCDYDEPHKHGIACGPKCACGLGMQSEKSQ